MLQTNFNTDSLLQKFNPKYFAQKKARELSAKNFAEMAAKTLQTKDLKKKQDVDSLAHLRENIGD